MHVRRRIGVGGDAAQADAQQHSRAEVAAPVAGRAVPGRGGGGGTDLKALPACAHAEAGRVRLRAHTPRGGAPCRTPARRKGVERAAVAPTAGRES